jgi:4-hydroxybenzoate polyprenyltransferase
MLNYIKLIRLPNLFMIALLQMLFRYMLVEPILVEQGKALFLTPFEFGLLVLSGILVAAGGYVINDIQDRAIDRINKPKKMAIWSKVSEEAAYNYYMALTFSGVIIGFYLTFIRQIPLIGIINLICAGFLYFYSTSYKCIPILGNVIISALTSFVIWMVILPEPFATKDPIIITLAVAYVSFSFLISMIREIVKDLEDIEGDKAFGCNTLPIAFGSKISKFITIALGFILISALIWIQITSKQWETPIPFYYIIFAIQVPLMYLIYNIWHANNNFTYSSCSRIAKFVMFTGSISILVFYFSF